MDRESLSRLLAQGHSLEQIAKRFGRHPSTIAYWLRKHGLEAAHRDRHAARGGLERDRLVGLIATGATVAECAAELGVSKSTVRHWLRRYGLRTQNSVGRRERETVRIAKEAGLLTTAMVCRRHGLTEFFLEGRGYYRCKRWRADAVSRRRRKVKSILVQEAGGRCCVCGYQRYLGALHFHRVQPHEKRLELNAKGNALSLATLRAEAQKCVLLCSNCHAEVEAGIASIEGKFEAMGSSVGVSGPG
jgi:transposase-like protein